MAEDVHPLIDVSATPLSLGGRGEGLAETLISEGVGTSCLELMLEYIDASAAGLLVDKYPLSTVSLEVLLTGEWDTGRMGIGTAILGGCC